MGCYGIGLERIMAAAIETGNDQDGIVWPCSIAPFSCLISVLNTKDNQLVEAAENTYQELQRRRVDVLLDDRDERPGVKFKDADLIGIPFRINFGSKKFKEGKVEWVERSSKKVEDINYLELVPRAISILQEAGIR